MSVGGIVVLQVAAGDEVGIVSDEPRVIAAGECRVWQPSPVEAVGEQVAGTQSADSQQVKGMLAGVFAVV